MSEMNWRARSEVRRAACEVRREPAGSEAGGTVKPKRARTPRTPRRCAVTLTEEMAAAQHALPSLRACTDVPRVMTADLKIMRGRGGPAFTNFPVHRPRAMDLPAPASRCLRAVRSTPRPRRLARSDSDRAVT